MAGPATLTAYVTGIRSKRAGVALPTVMITTARSAIADHPEVVALVPAGYVLTGGGARALPADPNGQGQLLTGSYPDVTPAGSVASGWRATSKDHAIASPGTVDAYAVSLRFAPAVPAAAPVFGVVPISPAGDVGGIESTGAVTGVIARGALGVSATPVDREVELGAATVLCARVQVEGARGPVRVDLQHVGGDGPQGLTTIVLDPASTYGLIAMYPRQTPAPAGQRLRITAYPSATGPGMPVVPYRLYVELLTDCH